MTPEQQKIVEELRQWRLNQPYMTSEEAREQFERVRRNVQSRWANAPGSNEASSWTGQGEKVVYSTGPVYETVSLAAEPSTPYSSTAAANAISSSPSKAA